MAFKGPHVCFVSFTIEITPAETTNVMVVETDLHLNSKHAAFNHLAVRRLIAAAQDYVTTNAVGVTHVRLISTHSGEI
ncbi:hypothetical protein ACH79_26650 [Bradyrhizobium sp. CCBAU 051011]|uniref:hypothetical protein n=1 Tax=Bradyrhizobium sp. CCBAU 051011 TaxID=858422 RepID=UPI00137421A0|nr:hypothetical protein [Bradyrhizobium sp. CCBAU 051011]QHO75673.1 hypothetical protein ACH79_26650 [Bradyrhizobium sp. CCBAU 051011]